MVKTIKSGAASHAENGGHELIEFRMLIAVAFVWFFVAAAVSRVVPADRQPEGIASCQGESCYKQAKRLAYTAIPFAFMK
jgi:hypothetical protein